MAADNGDATLLSSHAGRLSIAPACNVARTSLDHAARVFDIDAWRIDQASGRQLGL